jgi:hypothetical protein
MPSFSFASLFFPFLTVYFHVARIHLRYASFFISHSCLAAMLYDQVCDLPSPITLLFVHFLLCFQQQIALHYLICAHLHNTVGKSIIF